MTDRIIAVLIANKNGKALNRHEEALSLMYAVDSVTLVDDYIFVIFDREIRTDDFEVVDDALDLFGFTIIERVINDGSLAMLRGSAMIGARGDMINDHIEKKPTLNSTSATDIEQFVSEMAGWSYIMKKILEINFKE